MRPILPLALVLLHLVGAAVTRYVTLPQMLRAEATQARAARGAEEGSRAMPSGDVDTAPFGLQNLGTMTLTLWFMAELPILLGLVAWMVQPRGLSAAKLALAVVFYLAAALSVILFAPRRADWYRLLARTGDPDLAPPVHR